MNSPSHGQTVAQNFVPYGMFLPQPQPHTPTTTRHHCAEQQQMQRSSSSSTTRLPSMQDYTPAPSRQSTPIRHQSVSLSERTNSIIGSLDSPGLFGLGGSHTPKEQAAPVIFINGFPGTGKLTIAQELLKIIPQSKVFDNHLLIDPATTVFSRTDGDYQPLRRALRTTVLDAIVNSPSQTNTTWIFTEIQSNSMLGTSITHEYLSAAQRRNSPFISIIITCSLEANLKRLSSSSRRNSPRKKLTNREVLKSIRDEEQIHTFGEWVGVKEMVLDTSTLEPEEAAVLIKGFAEKAVNNQLDTVMKTPNGNAIPMSGSTTSMSTMSANAIDQSLLSHSLGYRPRSSAIECASVAMQMVQGSTQTLPPSI